MSAIEQTANLYRSLRFNAIGKGLHQLLGEAEANELSYLQFAHQLAEYEWAQRNRKRVERNRRLAGFPVHKTLEEFDYRHQSTITKRQVNQLLDFSFIDNRANLVFIGPPGVGKTHLAIGIGHKAIDAGFNALYEYRSIILTTNKEFTDWAEYFHHDNVAVPVVDRIIHHSHIFMMGGESYRLKHKTTT